MGKKNKSPVRSTKPHVTAASLHAKPARTMRLMQDVIKPTRHTPPHEAPHPDSPAAHIPKVRPARAMDIVPPSTIKHHQPQSAQTLMRHTVSKPGKGLKRQLGARTPTDVLIPQPNHHLITKWSAANVDPEKEKHAHSIHKSKMITRFAPDPASWYNTPSHEAAAIKTEAPTHLVAAPAEQKQSMDIFEQAIHHATSHQQPAVNPRKEAKAAKRATKKVKKPVHHRLSSVVAASLAFLLLTGFIAYQNKADLTLRFADAKAGFHATLPTYKPGGFAIGRFRYGAGNVAVNYKNGTSGQSYTFSQAASNLDSQSLLDNVVTPHNKSYQTLQTGGRTIFIFGDNDAAWVDEGILYRITSNGNLSTSDILSIAKSV